MSSGPDSGLSSRLVIGVGHAERQDDGVGPYVAAALGRRGQAAVVHQGEGTGLLDLWEARRDCVVVDAMADRSAPGLIHIFTDFDSPVFHQAAFVHSTHRFGLPEAIALGRTLGRLPARLMVIAVTGVAFDFGSDLSPPVATAAARLVETLAGNEDVFSEAFKTALLAA